MRHELKTFRLTCDWCKRTADVEDAVAHKSESYKVPPGWQAVSVHGCGMTGYTRRDDVCGECCTAKGVVNGEAP